MSKELDAVNVEIHRLREHEAYNNRTHPLHKQSKREMQELYEEKLRLEGARS